MVWKSTEMSCTFWFWSFAKLGSIAVTRRTHRMNKRPKYSSLRLCWRRSVSVKVHQAASLSRKRPPSGRGIFYRIIKRPPGGQKCVRHFILTVSRPSNVSPQNADVKKTRSCGVALVDVRCRNRIECNTSASTVFHYSSGTPLPFKRKRVAPHIVCL